MMAADLSSISNSPHGNGRSFYGRQELFTWIQKHLRQQSPTQPMLLYGPPRIGKTAVLQEILKGKYGRDIVPLYIDLDTLLHDSLSIFLGELAKTAATALQAAGCDLPEHNSADFVINPYKAFSSQFLSPALENLGHRKLLFLFDNVNLLLDAEKQGNFDPQTFDAFCRLIHAQPRAYTLFTLNYPLKEQEAQSHSILDHYPHYEIKALSQNETIDMIQKQHEFIIFHDAAKFIYQITHGHPADTQSFCDALKTHQEKQNLRHITVADVAMIQQRLSSTKAFAEIEQPSPSANFYIRKEEPKERTDYAIPRQKKGNNTSLLILGSFILLALIFLIMTFIFREPVQQRLAGGQPPTISETAVFLTSEALAAAMLASTPSATATAVPPATDTATPTDTPTLTPTPGSTDTPTISPTATPDKPVASYIRKEDDMVMRYVPGGSFMMGAADNDFSAAPDEKPQHEVIIEPFYLDQFEVSVAQYAAFLNRIGTYKEACEGNDCLHPRFEAGLTSYLLEEDQGDGSLFYIPLTGFANYPINHVSWHGAHAYCTAMAARLPTEAEWEFAARGEDGRIYPWGNERPDETRAVFNSNSYEDLKPVDALPAGQSPFGIYALAGSLWEWVNDWYNEDYYSESPRFNPPGPETGLTKVIRGGAWPNNNLADRIRSTNRSHFTTDFISATVGFRCAQDP
ncbi:MAG: hypothetical protein CSA11_11680 [Chloroflexi bacterium]|nr:MAG: hypothetical protein CSA11_11680 [Chloroflexota bacterium]